MCFLRKNKKVRPRFLILFPKYLILILIPKYLIFDGKAIQSGGQVMAHGFFFGLTENQVLVDFFDFQNLFSFGLALVYIILEHFKLKFYTSNLWSQNVFCYGGQNPYFQPYKTNHPPEALALVRGLNFIQFLILIDR